LAKPDVRHLKISRNLIGCQDIPSIHYAEDLDGSVQFDGLFRLRSPFSLSRATRQGWALSCSQKSERRRI